MWKVLNILVIAATVLIFSGCYTQLLVQDNPPSNTPSEPIVMQPAQDPVLILVENPDPVYLPMPEPPYVPPAYSNPVAAPAPPKSTQRTSGVQRSAPNTPQAPPQNTNRSSQPTRDGKR